MRSKIILSGILVCMFLMNSTLKAQVSGTVTVPSTTYPTLSSVISALNSQGVGSGGVVVDITSDNPQYAPIGGYLLGSAALNGTTSATNAITINGNSNQVTSNVGTSATTDGIFIIQGTDYVTINGLNLIDTNTTAATTEMEWGYALVKLNNAAPFDGCQYVTINNCTISLNAQNVNSVGIYIGNNTATSIASLSITATTDANSNNTFTANKIQNVYSCIYMSGYSDPSTPYALYDQNNKVGGANATAGNFLTNFGGGTARSYGVYMTYQNLDTVQYNQIMDTSVVYTGLGQLYGVEMSSGTNTTINVSNNLITLLTKNGYIGVNNDNMSGTGALTINKNIIQNCKNTGDASGTISGAISTGTGSSFATISVANNIIENDSIASSAGAAESMVSVGTLNSTTTNLNIDSNIVSNIYCSNAFIIGNGLPYNFYGNTIDSVSWLSDVYGVYIIGAGLCRAYDNKIYELSATIGEFNATNILGIFLRESGPLLAYNNYIGNIHAVGSSNDGQTSAVIAGIWGYLSSNMELDYNTIYLNTVDTNTSIYDVYDATVPLLLRNNIFINNSVPTGTGISAVLELGGGNQDTQFPLSEYNPSSNNNLFYCGTPGPSSLICNIYNSSTQCPTLGSFQAVLGGADENSSVTENVNFLSTVGSSSNFLHINPAIATVAESGGINIQGITTDYDGDIREGNPGYTGNGSAPDIGADEFNGSPVAPSVDSTVITPTGSQCAVTTHAVTATIAAGTTAITGGMVKLNYTFNGITQTPITMTSSGSNTWSGTIPAATPPNAAVTWSVIVNDGFNSKSLNGPSYQDAYLSIPVVSATSLNLCSGIADTLSASVVSGSSYNYVLGSGTSTSSSNNDIESPLNDHSGGDKTQMLITAAELNGIGLTAGAINSIGLNVTSIGSVDSLHINLATTANATLSSGFVTSGLSEVYSTDEYDAAVGIDIFQFSTPFYWDGVSNLVIQWCWSNNNSGGSTAQVKYDATSYTSTTCYRNSNMSAIDMCNDLNIERSKNDRAELYFNENKALPVSAYQWNAGTTGVGTTDSISVTPATATTVYTVTITDANNCSTTSLPDTINLFTAATITPAGPTTVCQDGSVVLNANTGAGLTYQWNNSGGAIAGATDASYIAITTDTYTVTVSNGQCSFTSPAITATINAVSSPSTAITILGATTICPGASVTLNADATAGLTYQWYNGATAITSATDASYVANADGSYTVNISNGSCSVTSVSTPVTVLNTAATVTASAPLSFCQGDSTVLTVSAGTGVTYQWYDGAVFTNNTTASYTANTSGSYTVVVTNGVCSGTSTASVITVNTYPAIPVVDASGPLSFCQGDNVILSASTVSGLTYQWYNGVTALTGATTASYTANSTGTYILTATSAGGCSATSVATGVVTNPFAVLTVGASGTIAFCQGDSVSLTVSATAATGATYQWQNTSGPISGATAASYTANTMDSYNAIVTTVNGCVDTSATTAVTVYPALVFSIMPAGAQGVCQGDTLQLNANMTGTATYQWTYNTLPIPGATSANYPVVAAGVYSVTVTNSTGCSASAANDTVTVNPIPTSIISYSSATSFCQGDSVRLQSNTITGDTYQWYRNDTAITNATATDYYAAASGTYTVTITSSFNCPGSSAPIPVNVYPLPEPVIVDNNPVLSVAAGYTTYEWFKGSQQIIGANTDSFTVIQSGVYSVSVTDSLGCTGTSASDSVTIMGSGVPATNTVKDAIKLYPNPANDVLYVYAPVPVKIVISTMEGQEVLHTSGTKSIDLSGLANAMYLVTISDANGVVLKIDKISKLGY